MSLSTYYYDPFYEPFLSVSDFNRFCDAAFKPRAPSTTREVSRSDDESGVIRPRMDLYGSKDKKEMTATFELPGLTRDDVEIAVHNNRLVVSGQCSPSDVPAEENFAVHERRYGKFSRTLPLPSGTKPEDIKAEMNNGILAVKFPKSQPEKEAKKIAIS